MRRPFRLPSYPELEWIRQFAVVALQPCMANTRARQFSTAPDVDFSGRLRRFKFLIYDGPSRSGKTEMGREWFGASRTLIVDTQSCETPNLRAMLTGKYKAILMEDGNWELCHRNRALVLSSTMPVQSNPFPCNHLSLSLNLFRVPIIICSNNFWSGCTNEEIREWIEQNSCYVRVRHKLYID